MNSSGSVTCSITASTPGWLAWNSSSARRTCCSTRLQFGQPGPMTMIDNMLISSPSGDLDGSFFNALRAGAGRRCSIWGQAQRLARDGRRRRVHRIQQRGDGLARQRVEDVQPVAPVDDQPRFSQPCKLLRDVSLPLPEHSLKMADAGLIPAQHVEYLQADRVGQRLGDLCELGIRVHAWLLSAQTTCSLLNILRCG